MRLRSLVPPVRRCSYVAGFFPKATEVRFGGSSYGGSCLKLDWFGVGLHMEFHYDGSWIVTSPIRSLKVLDASALPGPF